MFIYLFEWHSLIVRRERKMHDAQKCLEVLKWNAMLHGTRRFYSGLRIEEKVDVSEMLVCHHASKLEIGSNWFSSNEMKSKSSLNFRSFRVSREKREKYFFPFVLYLYLLFPITGADRQSRIFVFSKNRDIEIFYRFMKSLYSARNVSKNKYVEYSKYSQAGKRVQVKFWSKNLTITNKITIFV